MSAFGWAPAPPMFVPEVVTERDLKVFKRELHKAIAASERIGERRAKLPAGSSRAAITSLNAKWTAAAEYRERLRERYERALSTPSPAQPKGETE